MVPTGAIARVSHYVEIVMCQKGCGGEMSFYVVGEVTDVWLVMTFASSSRLPSLDLMNCQDVYLSEREAVEASVEFPESFIIPSRRYRRQEMLPSHNLGMSVNDLM